MMKMNRSLTYREWQRALAEPTGKVSDWFEETLHNYFTAWAGEHNGSVERNPRLPNGSRPDFRIEDHEGLACYVEAKGLFGPTGESDYFKWRIDLSDIQHPKSGGFAHYQVDGKMSQNLSESERDSIRKWVRELDPEAEPPEYQHYHEREFPCGGANCKVQIRFSSEESSITWIDSHFGTHRRNRIEEKVNEILKDPKTGHEKYTREALGGTALVLAILEVSSDDVVDLQGELYGNQFLKISPGMGVVDGGLTGIGIWRDEDRIRDDRAHIAGIWYWYGKATVTANRERPVLATNPYDPERRLPDCLKAFRCIEWRPGEPGRVAQEEADGGQSFDHEALRVIAHNYVDECRRRLSITREEESDGTTNATVP